MHEKPITLLPNLSDVTSFRSSVVRGAFLWALCSVLLRIAVMRQLLDVAANMKQRANPALQPTHYRGLRPLPWSAELEHTRHLGEVRWDTTFI
jgi:hypothetical protein